MARKPLKSRKPTKQPRRRTTPRAPANENRAPALDLRAFDAALKAAKELRHVAALSDVDRAAGKAWGL